jgi:hypothetical protein
MTEQSGQFMAEVDRSEPIDHLNPDDSSSSADSGQTNPEEKNSKGSDEEHTKLSALISDYSERCAEQRAKAEQYAKLWIYMLTIITLLFGLSLKEPGNLFRHEGATIILKVNEQNQVVRLHGDEVGGDREKETFSLLRIVDTRIIIHILLVLFVTIIITFICYTNITHSALLSYLKQLEAKMSKVSRHNFQWYNGFREIKIHPANKVWGGWDKASIFLGPLAIIGPLAYVWSFINLIVFCVANDHHIALGVLIVVLPGILLAVLFFFRHQKKLLMNKGDR